MEKKRIAVLIDGDNAESTLLEKIFEEVGQFGQINIKRVYGDFTSPHMDRWKYLANRFALNPISKFVYTKGKNSTDIALVIDAMDLLHSNNVDGLCLFSSDSDFAGLAIRAREQGILVIGIGRKQTAEALRNACDKFIITDNLNALTYSGENSNTLCEKDSTFKISVEKLTGPTVLGKLNGLELDRLKSSNKRRKGKRDKETCLLGTNRKNNNDLRRLIN